MTELTLPAFQHRLSAVLDVDGPVNWVLGLSGGLDSVVLMQLLSAHCHLSSDSVRAVYIDHGLQATGQSWAENCAEFCNQAGVALSVISVQCDSAGKGVEAAARKARYGAFSDCIVADETLVLAHHANDAAETFLFRALRGTGLKGLCAIPEQTTLQGIVNGKAGGVAVVRPLLVFTKRQLSAYAAQHQLTWLDDPSNDDTRFDRNYIRHEIMPRIGQRWPQFAENFSNTISQLGQSQVLLTEYLEQDLAALSLQTGASFFDVCMPLDVMKLCEFSRQKQFAILQYWTSLHAMYAAPANQLHSFLDQLNHLAPGGAPQLRWLNSELQVYGKAIHMLLPRHAVVAERCSSTLWQIEGFDITLRLEADSLKGNAVELADLLELTLRKRQPGDQLHRLKRARFSSSLKKTFNEASVPPWERDGLPVMVWQGAVVWHPSTGLLVKLVFGSGLDGLSVKIVKKKVDYV